MATLTQKQNAPKKVFAFRWNGVNRKGQKVSGELQADSINTVKAELRKQGVNVTKVSKKSQGLFSKGGAKIKPMDIAVVSRQITTMLSAGVPLVQSLQIIARSHEKAAMRELMGQIAADVETGTPMSEALRRHPRHFDDLYCDLVEAGEQSGALETIYDRIATYREKSEALKSKIKKAMFYPTMVILWPLSLPPSCCCSSFLSSRTSSRASVPNCLSSPSSSSASHALCRTGGM